MRLTCSIICYNYGQYLGQAIQSCLSQHPGHYELEVLVIDDGSSDETPEVCRRFRGRIRVSRSENRGFGMSLGRAIEEAAGDYVCLLDADDWFECDKLVRLLPFIHQGNLFIEHLCHMVDAQGRTLPRRSGGPGNTSTLCVKRSAARTLLPVQNEIFFQPLKKSGRGISLPDKLSFYRVHGSSMMQASSGGMWYHKLAEVTHSLADRLSIMASRPPDWAKQRDLTALSHEYRAIAFYNEMESALQVRDAFGAWRVVPKILFSASRSHGGITEWHLRVALRGFLGRPMVFK